MNLIDFGMKEDNGYTGYCFEQCVAGNVILDMETDQIKIQL